MSDPIEEPTRDGFVAREISSSAPTTARVREVAAVFLRLGITAFGGPAAHIAVMEDEIVRRRGWVTRERFLDLVSAANLIPGPNSTEVAIHLGYTRAGWRGLVMAGACFIVPATIIVWLIAGFYVRYGTRPELLGMMHGVQPVVLAVVMQALWLLGRSAWRSRSLVAVGVLSVVAVLAGVNEMIVLLAAGVAAVLADRFTGAARARQALVLSPGIRATSWWKSMSPTVGGFAGKAAIAVASASVPASTLFLSFAKIGCVLFGSGYVLLAFLRAEFVERHAWLTETQLLDAIAIGQVTPGPLFTSATFVGYLLAGNAGALASTAGIFLPAFIFVALSGPIVPRLRQSRTASAALDGVNSASLALMVAVTGVLFRTVMQGTIASLGEMAHAGSGGAYAVAWMEGVALALLPVVLMLVSAVLLIRYRVRSTWLLAGGAAFGLIMLR